MKRRAANALAITLAIAFQSTTAQAVGFVNKGQVSPAQSALSTYGMEVPTRTALKAVLPKGWQLFTHQSVALPEYLSWKVGDSWLDVLKNLSAKPDVAVLVDWDTQTVLIRSESVALEEQATREQIALAAVTPLPRFEAPKPVQASVAVAVEQKAVLPSTLAQAPSAEVMPKSEAAAPAAQAPVVAKAESAPAKPEPVVVAKAEPAQEALPKPESKSEAAAHPEANKDVAPAQAAAPASPNESKPQRGIIAAKSLQEALHMGLTQPATDLQGGKLAQAPTSQAGEQVSAKTQGAQKGMAPEKATSVVAKPEQPTRPVFKAPAGKRFIPSEDLVIAKNESGANAVSERLASRVAKRDAQPQEPERVRPNPFAPLSGMPEVAPSGNIGATAQGPEVAVAAPTPVPVQVTVPQASASPAPAVVPAVVAAAALAPKPVSAGVPAPTVELPVMRTNPTLAMEVTHAKAVSQKPPVLRSTPEFGYAQAHALSKPSVRSVAQSISNKYGLKMVWLAPEMQMSNPVTLLARNAAEDVKLLQKAMGVYSPVVVELDESKRVLWVLPKDLKGEQLEKARASIRPDALQVLAHGATGLTAGTQGLGEQDLEEAASTGIEAVKVEMGTLGDISGGAKREVSAEKDASKKLTLHVPKMQSLEDAIAKFAKANGYSFEWRVEGGFESNREVSFEGDTLAEVLAQALPPLNLSADIYTSDKHIIIRPGQPSDL